MKIMQAKVPECWNPYSKEEHPKQKTKDEIARFNADLDALIKKLSFEQVYGCCKLAIQFAAEDYNNEAGELLDRINFWANKCSDYRNHFKSVINGTNAE